MSRPKRLQTFSYVGCAQYFLTFCAFRRQQVFIADHVVESMIAQFRRAASAKRFAILAYCFMPDHAHFLVEGLDDCSKLRDFAHAAKRDSGYVFKRDNRTRLWQEGYYERVLRPGESPRMVARYILDNPVRARLVKTPRDYPYLGSDVWSLDELFESIV